MQAQTDDNVNDSQFSIQKDGTRRKRRSKNDNDGRNAKCKHCDKTYLSAIALNNHVKSKHAHLVDIVLRSRGRPRKLDNDRLTPQQEFEQKFKSFYENMLRKRNDDEKYDLIESSKETFDNMYNKYKESLFRNITSADELGLIHCSNETIADYAFWKYIEYTHSLANRDYFEYVFKFVVLFRECINIEKKDNYTMTQSAEIVPDMCNLFISEFMERNDFYGLDINELIELIQHFCHWLWLNNYTSSRLSLINS